jgi:serine/threonine protein kinase
MMNPERWQQITDSMDKALGLQGGERAAFLARLAHSDPELHAEVVSLLSSHAQAGAEFLNTPVAPPALELSETLVRDPMRPSARDPMIGRRLGPYQIVELIGVGGMGEVYRAVRADDEYRKQVALKLVRAGLDSAAVVNRFKNERQILASLDHPNIARLLDGGTTGEGIPYFVMELIEGQTIDCYCDDHNLATTERLKLFLQICSAVQLAHQRLIVHRDLKPSNILVTSEGLPRLLDFGIAKLVDPSTDPGTDAQISEPTLTQFRAFTPGYASPEQIKGEPITTASDVYSLGVVLYELLTGKHPYRVAGDTPEKVARAVCETNPRKPSSVVGQAGSFSSGRDQQAAVPSSAQAARDAERLSKRLKGDLDNIVLMALRKEPQRRYSSVEKFAEDIRRHLEHLPVTARNDTAWYRATKFVARHKVGVAATAGVAVIVLAALGVTLREARIAREQRARAEQRFNDVRTLANSLMFEFHDSIKDLAGATPARELLVRRSQEYLDRLAREAKDDPALQQELATSYLKLGAVQGDPGQANLGDRAGALASFGKALAILETLSAARPDDRKLQRDTAFCYQQLARISPAQEGERLYRRSVAMLEELSAKDPTDTQSRRNLATGYTDLSYIHGNPYGLFQSFLDTAGSLEYAKKALDLREQLFRATPTDATAVYDVFEGYHQVADMLWVSGHLSEALRYEGQAQALMKDFVTRNPTNGEARRLLTTGCGRVQKVLEENGQLAESWKLIRSCSQDIFALGAADPKNMMVRRQEVSGYNAIGELLLKMSHVSGSIVNHTKALDLSLSVIAADPSNTDSRYRLANSYGGLGNALGAKGNLRAALENSHRAVDIRKALLETDPANVRVRGSLAKDYLYLGMLQAKNGDAQGSLESCRSGLSILEPMAKADPANWLTERILADLYRAAGIAESELARNATRGQSDQHRRSACSFFEKNENLWEDMRKRNVLINADLPRAKDAARKSKSCVPSRPEAVGKIPQESPASTAMVPQQPRA